VLIREAAIGSNKNSRESRLIATKFISLYEGILKAGLPIDLFFIAIISPIAHNAAEISQ